MRRIPSRVPPPSLTTHGLERVIWSVSTNFSFLEMEGEKGFALFMELRLVKIIQPNYTRQTHFRSKGKRRLKVKRQKKMLRAHGNQRRAREVIPTSDKIDFKSETLKMANRGHYVIIKGQSTGKK